MALTFGQDSSNMECFTAHSMFMNSCSSIKFEFSNRSIDIHTLIGLSKTSKHAVYWVKTEDENKRY